MTQHEKLVNFFFAQGHEGGKLTTEGMSRTVEVNHGLTILLPGTVAKATASRRDAMCSRPFCLEELWCSEWNCCGRMEKTSQNTAEPTRHFSEPTSPSSMKAICSGFVPKNTAKVTTWAKRVFDEW